MRQCKKTRKFLTSLSVFYSSRIILLAMILLASSTFTYSSESADSLGSSGVETGSVSGSVFLWNEERPLEGATVSIIGTMLGAMTDSEGHFFITGVPSGNYGMNAVIEHLGNRVVDSVMVIPGDTLQVDFVMRDLREWSTTPLVDTILSKQIVIEGWWQTHATGNNGIPRYESLFNTANGINWIEHPGQLRLGPERKTILDSLKNLRMIEPMDFNGDGELDILGIVTNRDDSWTYNITEWSTRATRSNSPYLIFRDTTQVRNWTYTEGPSMGMVNSLKVFDIHLANIQLIILSCYSNDGIVTTWSHWPLYYGWHSVFCYLDCDYEYAMMSADIWDLDENGIPEFVGASLNNEIVLFKWYSDRESDFICPLFTQVGTTCLGNRTIIDGVYINEYWIVRVINDSIVSPFDVRVTDLDLDGDPEILVASNEDNALTILTRVSDQGSYDEWDSFVIKDSTYMPGSVEIADMNSDGRPDIVTSGDSIGVFINPGQLDRWREIYLKSSFHNCMNIHCCDMDGDEDLDILASGDNGISWFRNEGIQNLQWPEILIEFTIDRDYRDLEFFDIDFDGRNEVVSLIDGTINYWEDQYAKSGELISEVILVNSPSTMYLDWESTFGGISSSLPGTTVSFRIRSSPSRWVMSDWSRIIESPGMISDCLVPGARYIQYKVLLSTDDPNITPVLESITFTYSYHGLLPVGQSWHD